MLPRRGLRVPLAALLRASGAATLAAAVLAAAVLPAAAFSAGVLAAAALPAAAAADGPAPAGAAFTLEAARRIVDVSSPSISPDGKRVVYVRSHGDYEKDKTLSELAIVDVAGGAPRTLTRERDGVAAPQWSPQGDRLAFLASPGAGKPAQIYVMPMDGGDATAVTSAKSGVEAFAWKPDGTQLAFVARDQPADPDAAAQHRDAFAVGDDDFLARAAPLPAHVWLVGADGTGAKQLTSGAASVAEASPWLHWAPDGKTLIFPEQPDATFAHFTKTRVVAYDLASGAQHPLLAVPVAGYANFSADGTKLVYIAPRHGSLYLQQDAYVVDEAGKALGDSLGIDRSAHWAELLPNGTLAYGANDGVRAGLWFLTPGAPARRVDLGDVDFAFDASVASDGTLAFVGASTAQPHEIYVLRAGARAPQRLTDENAFARGFALGRAERIDWVIDNGMRACGVLTYPPGFTAGRTYPLVLIVHGGPVSASLRDFSAAVQALAARGFLVFQPNYRGSDDLGDAFLQAIVGHPTSGPGRDNLAGLAALEALGIVDTARIGVSGWSGGGLQTSWLIGHAHVWKAAMSGAGVDDWFEQAVLADISEEFVDVFMGGATPWTPEGRALFESESPITYAGTISTPLLLLSDTADQRVPITQSYALFHALRDRGQRVRFVAFPRAGHFPADPVGREAVYRTWFDWFTTELK